MTLTKGMGALLLAVTLLLPFELQASERGSSRQAKVLLDNAVRMLEEQGPEVAFASFNDPQGRFVQNDLYIFAANLDGTYTASGANPKLVGQNFADLTDAAGTPVGQDILNLAKLIGHGIVEYEWLNRATNDVEHKFSRIRRVGEYVLGVGFYLPDES